MANDKREKLTKSQTVVYEFLVDYIEKNKIPPSIREICDATKLNSTSTVHSHLVNLGKKGYIERDSSKNRAMRVISKGDSGFIVNVPILGTVTAGVPILAEELVDEFYPMPVELRKYDDSFMLRVRGDSMIEAGINNGDLVHVKKQATANNGEIIVALIEDSATVKKVYFDKDGIRLQPCNEAYSPIISRDIKILGKVIGLYRSYN
ncbi:MAG: transcriptional repressor LexA [Lachnospirales bacterium]